MSYDTTGLIKTVFSIDFTELNTQLAQMSKKIAGNAKMLTQLTSDFFQARASTEELSTKMRENQQKNDEAIYNLQRRMAEMERKWDEDLPNEYTAIKVFNASQVSTTNVLTTLEEKIVEVENCDGVKVQATVEKNVGRHLRRWYGPVRDRELSDLKQELQTLRGDIEKRLLDEIDLTEGNLSVRINEGARLATQELKDVSEEKNMQISQLRSVHLADKDELLNVINFNEKTIRRDLQFMDERLDKRFDAGETRTAALLYSMNLPEEQVDELYANGKAGKGTINEDTGEDERVTLMHNTLPFLDLRSKMQHDIRVRIKQSKEDDQDDFSKTVVEVQRDIKKKPDTSRVLQMIQDSVDKALYETVDLLKAKVSIMETGKVGVVEFEEALKVKSDQKSVEVKADRNFVNSLFEFLRSKVDQLQQDQSADLADAVRRVLEQDYGLIPGVRLAAVSGTPAAGPMATPRNKPGTDSPMPTPPQGSLHTPTGIGGAGGVTGDHVAAGGGNSLIATSIVSSSGLRRPRPPGSAGNLARLSSAGSSAGAQTTNASNLLLIAAGEGMFSPALGGSTSGAVVNTNTMIGDNPRDIKHRRQQAEAAAAITDPHFRWAAEPPHKGLPATHGARRQHPASASRRRRPPTASQTSFGDLSPLDDRAPGEDSPADGARAPSTRAYDDYVKAIQYNDGVSAALEDQPVDAYVIESARGRGVGS